MIALAATECGGYDDPRVPVAWLTGVVTSRTPLPAGVVTATLVGASVYRSCGSRDAIGGNENPINAAGGTYRLEIVSASSADTTEVCVVAWVVRTSGATRDSVGASPIVMNLSSGARPDTARVDFVLP